MMNTSRSDSRFDDDGGMTPRRTTTSSTVVGNGSSRRTTISGYDDDGTGPRDASKNPTTKYKKKNNNNQKHSRYGTAAARGSTRNGIHPVPQKKVSILTSYEIPGPPTTRTEIRDGRGVPQFNTRTATTPTMMTMPSSTTDNQNTVKNKKNHNNDPSSLNNGETSSLFRSLSSSSSSLVSRRRREETGKLLLFCSWEEFKERQELHQVSIFEATMDTISLPQIQRIFDPRFVVAKFRRSAAGRCNNDNDADDDGEGDPCNHTYIHSKSTLESLLDHLIRIATTLSPTINDDDDKNKNTLLFLHHYPNWQQPWTEFLVDRLRACQADATRLLDRRPMTMTTATSMGSTTDASSTNIPVNDAHNVGQEEEGESILSPLWHVWMIRLLIWIRYWMPWNDEYFDRTTRTMLSTALEQYWDSRHSSMGGDGGDGGSRNGCLWDDEILSYTILLRLSDEMGVDGDGIGGKGLQTTFLEYTKYIPPPKDHDDDGGSCTDYPRWNAALTLSASIVRGEYYHLFHHDYREEQEEDSFPSILSRCCLASRLAIWRYKQCQQYNVAFGKQEGVSDLHHLLGLDSSMLSIQHVHDYLGLPCRQQDDVDPTGKITVIFKQNPMAMDPPFQEGYKDHAWVFRNALDITAPMKISSQMIQTLLRSKLPV